MFHLVGFAGSCQLAQIRIQNTVRFAQQPEDTKFSCFAQRQPQRQRRLSSQDKGLLGTPRLGYGYAYRKAPAWLCCLLF